MKLFVGLGNPGDKYAGNRHNVGFMAVERIAAHQGLPPWRKRFQAMVTEGQIGSEKVLLIKPQTYYNEVGRAVGEAARFHKIGLADIVVFHDEIDLAPAKIRVKTGGGSAGNNGLKSITQHLGADFVRVRVGVGHPGQKELVAGYVLHDFPRADALWLETMLDAIAAASPRLAAGDIERFQTDVAQRMSAVAPRPDDKTDGSAAQAPGSASRPGRPPSSARQPGGKPAAGRPDTAKSRRSAPSQRDLARKSAAPAPRKAAAKQTPAPAAPASPAAPEPAPSTALADRLKRWLTGQRKDD